MKVNASQAKSTQQKAANSKRSKEKTCKPQDDEINSSQRQSMREDMVNESQHESKNVNKSQQKLKRGLQLWLRYMIIYCWPIGRDSPSTSPHFSPPLLSLSPLSSSLLFSSLLSSSLWTSLLTTTRDMNSSFPSQNQQLLRGQVRFSPYRVPVP